MILDFWNLWVGANQILHHFLKVACLFCNKTINENKSRRRTTAEFNMTLQLKLHGKFQESLRLSVNELRDCEAVKKSSWTFCALQFFFGAERALINFSTYRVGAYARWNLLQCLAVNRTNTVVNNEMQLFCRPCTSITSLDKCEMFCSCLETALTSLIPG